MNVILILMVSVSPLWAADLVGVTEHFVTLSQAEDDLDSIAIYHGRRRDLAIVTAKASHRLFVFDAVTGAPVTELGGKGSGPGQFLRPNGILVHGDLLFVVERDNHRVQVLSLPQFKHIAFVGTDLLRQPYGLDVYSLPNGHLRMFVTDDYDEPADGNIPEGFYKERIKSFLLEKEASNLVVTHQRSFGDSQGLGHLFKVESIKADPALNRLYICNEKGESPGVKIYDLNGNFTGKTLNTVTFHGEPEGLAIYPTGETEGFLVATDQQPDVSLFHVFSRNSLELLGTFKGLQTANTDGIVIDNASRGNLDRGGLWAIHDDQALACFNWKEVLQALNIN